MLKVLFYHANDTIALASSDKELYLGVAALYLKVYLDKNRPDLADKVKWLIPIQRKLTESALIDICNKEKPDMLCTSHYIWNHSFLIEQLNNIKLKIPTTTKIVAGGPSIDVNVNKQFFNDYPFIDYAIYGAGESAFANLVDSVLSNKKLLKFNTSNLGWYDADKKKQIVSEFKYVPQSTVSPYLSNKDLFTDMINQEVTQGVNVIVPYDLTRGCPYACTFCDWNSGLSNKVSRRKNSYKDEIDLFQQLSIKNLYLSDANVGQYDEDIDMIAYLAKKNIEDNAGFKIDGNFSKLRKKNNLKIYHLMAKGNLTMSLQGFTFSVQDTNETVLKNIDRPDVGWDVHLEMIKELHDLYPDIILKIQLMLGLPGQTLETWRETLKITCQHNIIIHPYISEFLPASPSSLNKEYQDKFKFIYSNSERFQGGHRLRGLFTESCVSFSKHDFVKMTVLGTFYSALAYFRHSTKLKFDVEKSVDEFLESKNYKILTSNLWENWNNQDKFYYTVQFDGNPMTLAAHKVFDTGMVWISSPAFFKMTVHHLYDNNSAPVIKKFLSLYYRQQSINIPEFERDY